MRKIITVYGLISGGIVAALMFATMPFWKRGIITMDNGEVVGYTTMIIALSLVFFGIRSCRDNHFGGSITFGQGLKVGLLISAIASVMYAIAWEISYRTIAPDFITMMTEHYLEEARHQSASEAEVDAAVLEMESFRQWYANPLLRFGVTLLEILPVGILISLASAGILRKKSSDTKNMKTI